MNEQEQFWRGEFGDEYHKRQTVTLASNIAFFTKALSRTNNIKRVIELGAGAGLNMLAISKVLPNVEVMGVEINESAALQAEVGYMFRQSIFDFEPPMETPIDLVFTKGLLIHISPEHIHDAYAKLYDCSSRYILVAEYHSQRMQALSYRGEDNKLWKGPYAEQMLEGFYPDLQLVDYGFVSRFDPNFPQDDITWFLMEKR